jgi:hypothetical protein
LALGKSISEVRNLSFEEYSSWRAFYQLEPWGWHDEEYRTSALLAMMVNVNASKRKDAKNVKDFFRNMLSLTEKAYLQVEHEANMREKYRNATKEERMRMIASTFGVKDKK